MNVEQIRALVTEGVLDDIRACRSELDAVRAVRGLLDARELAVLARLDDLTTDGRGPSPEEELAAAAKKSTGSADKVRRRKKVADDVPELGLALEEGDTSGERLDLVARATRLRSWRDHDGMFCLSGRFDPESGLAIEATLRRMVEAMVHSGIPENAPVDPIDRQQYLTAVALVRVLTGAREAGTDGTSGGFAPGSGPDITVIIDEHTFAHGRHAETRFEVGFDLTDNGLPVATIRRALRVLYPTCALCDMAFENCEVHHLHPWEQGGLTDIDNLLPLCVRHHHLAHEGGWHLDLASDRTLKVIRPGGEITLHGPPTIRAASPSTDLGTDGSGSRDDLRRDRRGGGSGNRVR